MKCHGRLMKKLFTFDKGIASALTQARISRHLVLQAVGAMSVPTHLPLKSGAQMPTTGLGLWKSKPGEVGAAVRAALESGVRLLDGAAAYDNEPEIGSALAQAMSGKVVSRGDIFVVSKLPNTMHVWGEDASRVQQALDKTLSDLRLEYLDLYLMHWPYAFLQTDLSELGGLRLKDGTPNPKIVMEVEFLKTYAEMLKLKKAGKVNAVGVCNFTQAQLQALLEAFPEEPPCVNQCEIHPYLTQPDLKAFCDSHGIAMMAYSPLGSGDSYSGVSFPSQGSGPFQNPKAGSTLLENSTIREIAAKAGKTAAQILIHWSVRRGFSCIPKSVKASRIRENSDIFNWQLDEEDLNVIDTLNCGFRYGIGYGPGHYDCPNAPWYTAPDKRQRTTPKL
eukprot:TRINITY_DN49091_c0_g1_i1.p1 TRINITY_DN49091_c0_g1~~TRINITY_DN49091_c0_g1_i1.p1  ORF type:complete len:391 (-),score=75.23 TRINITY_DN49091_c0_g1_i1:65-1237(-)